MADSSSHPARAAVEACYRSESRRVLATLIRLLGDFERAEEALQDAFAAALVQWPRDGIPENPRAWLVSAGRFKAIDRMRRRVRHDAAAGELEWQAQQNEAAEVAADESLEDDRLRLIFTCCHPALDADARVALTLREVCDLTTEEVASAFLAKPATIAQRIVRAKRRIRDAGIAYEVPERDELPQRLDAVLRVIYLVFNEGYCASSGAELVRTDLCGEAIRVCRLLVELLPDPEAVGLLALMLLQESRRAARTDAAGDLITLEAQDRTLWDRDAIAEGRALVAQALATRRVGPYCVQAAIAAVHAAAPRPDATDWGEIVGLYEVLLQLEPSPVVELNHAVAVAMRDGPAAGLERIDAMQGRGALADYHLLHAAQADLYRRLGRAEAARDAYRRALALAQQDPERRYLSRRLAELEQEGPARRADSAGR